jgi:N-acetylgalactosamine 4-sulfate 6-O-sulfotransferase
LAWDLIHWEDRYPGHSKPPYNNAHLIHAVAPGSKIIMIVRDPVERLYSDYLYFNNGEKRNAQKFDTAVKKEMSVMSGCLSRHDLQTCCYDSHNDPNMRINLGVYICYIRDWYEAFGRDNLLVVSLEDYSKQPLPVLSRIFSFIRVQDPGLEVLKEYLTPRKNTRKEKDTQLGAMLTPTRRLLQDFYWPYNVQLARFLNDTRFLYNSL